MKKAQSLIEIALMFCIIIFAALGTIAIYNNLKTKLTDMTKPRLKSQLVQPVKLKADYHPIYFA